MAEVPARGSDDEYCSVAPSEGHHMVSHSVDAWPIRFVMICSLCRRISNKDLREQLRAAGQGDNRLVIFP